MKNFICLLMLACLPLAAAAQKTIAVHHLGVASFFTELTAAYNAAVSGDTIYIPGGTFEGLGLQKSLTLIGVGHNPDSTLATGQSILGGLDLYSSSSNSSISGIMFNGVIKSLELISSVSISRCNLNNGILFYAAASNWIISENRIGTNPSYSTSIFGPTGYTASNFLLSNNIIQVSINSLNLSEFSNNIFISGAVNTSNSTFKNNIFVSNFEGNTSNSQWYNNLNSGVNGGPTGGGNTGSNNYLDGIPLTTAFINYSPSNTFFQNNFHVVNPAYLGIDGTPIGIYGGSFPWKEGSLPFTPHIRTKIINSITNPDGTLHINLVVKAQQN